MEWLFHVRYLRKLMQKIFFIGQCNSRCCPRLCLQQSWKACHSHPTSLHSWKFHAGLGTGSIMCQQQQIQPGGQALMGIKSQLCNWLLEWASSFCQVGGSATVRLGVAVTGQGCPEGDVQSADLLFVLTGPIVVHWDHPADVSGGPAQLTGCTSPLGRKLIQTYLALQGELGTKDLLTWLITWSHIWFCKVWELVRICIYTNYSYKCK